MTAPTRRNLLLGTATLSLLATSAAHAVDPGFYRPYPQAPSRRNPRFDDMLFLDRDGVMHGSRDFRGKVLFLHFWGSWCPPCVAEIPILARLQAQFAQDPRMAFIFLNGFEPVERSRLFLARVQAALGQYEIISDTADRFLTTLNADGHRRQLFNDYQVQVYPTTLLIDRNGLYIAHYGTSNRNWLDWVPLLNDILDHSAPYSMNDPGADLSWMVGEWRSETGHILQVTGSRSQPVLHWTMPDTAPALCQSTLHYANGREAYLSVDLPDGSLCKLTLTPDGTLSGARQMPGRGTVILPMAMRRA